MSDPLPSDDDRVCVILHSTSPCTLKKEDGDCPVCKKKTSFLWEVFAWYPSISTCLNCGDVWSEGELLQRPFSPGWRSRNIQKALKRLRGLEESEKQQYGETDGF